MTMTLEMQDLDSLTDAALRQFDAGVSQTGTSGREKITQKIQRLEAEAQQIYRIVALLQKNEEDLERVAVIWGKMVSICDAFAARVVALSKQYPEAQFSCDRILDLRSAAEERRQLHAA